MTDKVSIFTTVFEFLYLPICRSIATLCDAINGGV